MRRGPRYSRDDAREAIAASSSFAEALRRLGMRPAGGNHATLKKYVDRWGISTDHFDPAARRREHLRRLSRRSRVPLEQVLVRGSSYSRGSLKRRLYAEGIRDRKCELCGQGELWRGRRMSLILDHTNGDATDNRLENLRIVCPNCAATLETHCGRNPSRSCAGCGATFRPRFRAQRFCSVQCHTRTLWGVPRPERRSARDGGSRPDRPPYERLVAEIAESGYRAVGRKYGVSDNAIRKWVRQYRRERVRRCIYACRMRGPVTAARWGRPDTTSR